MSDDAPRTLLRSIVASLEAIEIPYMVVGSFETRVATATAEDTVIAKLEWAKQGASDRQLEDVAGILRVRGPDLDLVYIEHWVAELELAGQWQRARAAV